MVASSGRNQKEESQVMANIHAPQHTYPSTTPQIGCAVTLSRHAHEACGLPAGRGRAH